jgi:hypothetical protein
MRGGWKSDHTTYWRGYNRLNHTMLKHLDFDLENRVWKFLKMKNCNFYHVNVVWFWSTEGRSHKLSNSEDIITLALLVPEISLQIFYILRSLAAKPFTLHPNFLFLFCSSSPSPPLHNSLIKWPLHQLTVSYWVSI